MKKILANATAPIIVLLSSGIFMPAAADIPGCPANVHPVDCGIDKSSTGAGLLSGNLADILGKISKLLLFIVGALAIIMIIIGGLRYVISGGNSSATAEAKDTILYAVVGLVVAAAAFTIISFVQGRFGF